MSGIRITPYVAAALLQYAKENGSREVFRGDMETIEEVANRATGLTVNEITAQAALDLLTTGGLATVEEDELAGQFFKIDGYSLELLAGRAQDRERDVLEMLQQGRITELDELRNESRYQEFFFFEDNPVVRRYFEFGDAWLTKAFNRLKDLPADNAVLVPQDFELKRIPNRTVSLDQSSAEVSLIHTGLSDISESVAQNNEVGDALGDDRPAMLAELSAARTLLSADRVRLRPLLRLLGGTLRWLSEKAAGTMVAEAAKHLWKLLYGLFF